MEFIQWIHYLDEDINRFHRQDFFLASIAAEIRRSNAKHPEKVKNDSFLIEFSKKKIKPDTNNKLETSKSFWAAHLG